MTKGCYSCTMRTNDMRSTISIPISRISNPHISRRNTTLHTHIICDTTIPPQAHHIDTLHYITPLYNTTTCLTYSYPLCTNSASVLLHCSYHCCGVLGVLLDTFLFLDSRFLLENLCLIFLFLYCWRWVGGVWDSGKGMGIVVAVDVL